jgi:hypothetical protein
MKIAPIAGALVACLAVQSCVGNLNDDGFAHAVKSGDARRAVAMIEPGQARLHITERDGRTYYPIHYAICRGDAETTFALLRNGSPTSLDGKSLAYNAARINRTALARQLAAQGYGTSGDISSALAENRETKARTSQQVNAGAALATVALFALMASSSGGGEYNHDSSGFTESQNRQMDADEYHYWQQQYGSGN